MKVRKFGVAKASNRVLLASLVEEIQQNLIKFNKNRNNPFRCCSSCRALVISGMDLALRASSYAHSMPLIAITTVITSIEKKKQRLCKPKKLFLP